MRMNGHSAFALHVSFQHNADTAVSAWKMRCWHQRVARASVCRYVPPSIHTLIVCCFDEVKYEKETEQLVDETPELVMSDLSQETEVFNYPRPIDPSYLL